MASIYKRDTSPFWWVKYRNPATGKVIRESTKFYHGIESESRKARLYRDELSVKENSLPSALRPWREWVTDFMSVRHAASPRTLQRKLIAWRTVQDYLEGKQVFGPKQLNRDHCVAFVQWRVNNGHFQLKARKKVSYNTALYDLKCLSNVMWEAVSRGYVAANPCQRLGLKKKTPREKSELTDDQIGFIRKEIKRKLAIAKTEDAKQNADFLNVSFELALLQGLRLAETYFPISDVDWENQCLRVVTKGDKVQFFPLNPAAIPLLKRLRKEGRDFTYIRPRMPSLNWWKFFNKLRKKRPDLKNTSLHSTRVTMTSRLERAGMPEAVAMKVLSHASTMVHRVYRRVKQHEVSPFWSHVAYGAKKPSSAGNQGCSQTNPEPPGEDSVDHD